MTKSVDIRELVLGILVDVTENDNYSHMAINNTLKKYQHLEKQDRAFISRLSEGCIEYLIQIDYIINQFSSVKVKKMKPIIRNILRMGVYQIKFMDNVPDSAACNEAVKLAQKKGFHNLKGFVNGVLRNISRNINEVVYPDKDKDKTLYLSVKYSVPEWIIKKWIDDEGYGYDTVEKILVASFEEKKTTIRYSVNKTTKDEIIKKLTDNQVVVTKGEYLPYALKIAGYNYIADIDGFKDGLFQVQDESSMLVAEIADVDENDFIIDVCAAPGGKSLHVAEKLNSTGMVSSRDLTDYKVSLINDNILRLGLSNILSKKYDALELDLDVIAKADIVIADLPCSGLGVFGKKTDIKYKITYEKQKELVELQRQILSVVHQYVKPGGVLIYSTCTINKDENIHNVEWFLNEFDFELETIDKYIPKSLQCQTTKVGYIQLLPGIHNTDGFFIARLKRKII